MNQIFSLFIVSVNHKNDINKNQNDNQTVFFYDGFPDL